MGLGMEYNGYIEQCRPFSSSFHPFPSISPNGRRTAERRSHRSTRAKDSDQTFDSSPSAHSGASQTAHDVKETAGIEENVLHVTTDPTLHATVKSCSDARDGVKALTRQGGIGMNLVAKVYNAREGISEVETEETTNEVDDAIEVGDGSSNKEGDDPVARTKGVPQPAALLAGDEREVKDLLEDLNIDSLHANVEVED